MARSLPAVLATCCCCFCLFTLKLQAQPPTAPVVSPRGVVNAYTQVPAPSQVTAGGIIWINGLNLGPAEGAKASGLPLPTELGGIKVLINNREAPLYSASLNRVEAQVPVDAPVGAATVVVQRGSDSSRPARVNVVALAPALRSAGDSGFGEAASKTDGGNITVFGTGFGPTDPRPTTGDIAGDGASLVNPVRAYIGGLAATATAVPSATRPGEFEITVTVPVAAQAGDLLNVITGNTAATPRRLYKAATKAQMTFLPLPTGPSSAAAPPDLRALTSSDLRGAFAMAAGPRGGDGCYAAYRLDFSAMTFGIVEPCVTAGNRNQPNPFTSAVEGNAIAALAGPPEGELPNGVSSKLAIFSAGAADVMKADLPATALNLNSQNGNFRVNLTSTNPAAVIVDADTGEVSPAPAGGGGGGLGGGGGAVVIPGGGALAAICLSATLTVDLGDGVNKIVGCTQMGQTLVSVVTDSEDAPTKAKLATLNPQGQVLNSADFPAGFLPVILPAIQIPAGGGGGGGLPGGAGALVNRIRTAVFVDNNVAYVVSRAADSSRDALAAFASSQQTATALPLPDGWFAASCSTTLRIFTLDLARQIGFPATKTAEKDNKANCPAFGLVLFDRETRRISISESPGSEGFNAASQAGDVADFVYTVSTNPQRVNIAESLYALDSTNGSSFRLDLPPGVIGFGQIREEPALFSLLAPANATVNGNGDAGIAVFDLDSASARLLPTPDGYSAVQILSIFETTRKVVARGTKNGNTGSSILIYDLVSGDLYIPNAPASCAFAGTLPAAAGGAGGGGGGGGGAAAAVNLTAINPKANTLTVGCYDASRKLSGFLFIRSN